MIDSSVKWVENILDETLIPVYGTLCWVKNRDRELISYSTEVKDL